MLVPYRGILPKIYKSAFVEDSAMVIGDVEVGQDSSIWFNCVVRGDVNFIRIGRRTNIQDGCILHVTRDLYPLFLADEITLGHGVILHGCRIHSRTLIGMGALVLDNAVVEEDCIVGAGAVVAENTVIPKGMLALGVPAKPIRPLRPEEYERIRRHAGNYVEYKNIYLEEREKMREYRLSPRPLPSLEEES